MNKYLIKITWSDDDDAYIAEIPELPGCVSHGETITRAAANAEDAIRLWLDSAKKHGDPIPDPDPIRSRLDSVGNLLNVSELARRSGIKRTTLSSKLKRKTPLTDSERNAVKKVLETV